MTILDLENPRAKGATAVLVSKRLGIRLRFRIDNAPPVRAIASVGRGNAYMMIPTQLVVEYTKTDEGGWDITLLRAYGYKEDEPNEKVLNIYPHDDLDNHRMTPAWIRDAAVAGKP